MKRHTELVAMLHYLLKELDDADVSSLTEDQVDDVLYSVHQALHKVHKYSIVCKK